MIIAHQPGSNPLPMPDAVPNPAHQPQQVPTAPVPEKAPQREPVKEPARTTIGPASAGPFYHTILCDNDGATTIL